MVNPEVIEDILDYAQITKDDVVLEIGPGVGFVTEQLVKYAKKVIAVELDEEALKDKLYDGKWTTPRQYYEDGSVADW